MNLLFIARIIQIVSAVFMIFLVLIQGKGGGLSSTFGGSISFYRSKRGVEKVIFYLTIFMGITLVVNSLIIIAFI